MGNIRVMRAIKPSYNKKLIYIRLGYRKNSIRISEKQVDEIEEIINKAERILNLTAAYRFVDILDITTPEVVLEDGTILKGKMLSQLLEGCNEVLLMLATGGEKIMDYIAKLQKTGRMSDALIVDAAASEITDSALNVVMAHVEQNIRPQGKALTKMRFSPGYQDFDLSQQQNLYQLLNADKFGIRINEANLLIPEKSVFAIAGVGTMRKSGGIDDKERV